jgi:hypothetical protein
VDGDSFFFLVCALLITGPLAYLQVGSFVGWWSIRVWRDNLSPTEVPGSGKGPDRLWIRSRKRLSPTFWLLFPLDAWFYLWGEKGINDNGIGCQGLHPSISWCDEKIREYRIFMAFIWPIKLGILGFFPIMAVFSGMVDHQDKVLEPLGKALRWLLFGLFTEDAKKKA